MKRGRNQRRRPGGANPNRALDSNGPDVRIRGTANQIYDKYQQLARDASSSGDRVKAENYLQHAEHYFRLIRSMQPAQQPNHQGADAEGDQPSIDDNDQDQQPQRDSRHQQRGRRNGADDGAGEQRSGDQGAGDQGDNDADKESASAGDDEPKAAAPDAGPDSGPDSGDEEKKPRRRRTPRRSVKKDEDSAETPAAAAAE
ncbi:DUF4167 domain-containing protein [Hyphococcus sp.]|jgi:hypothetical protein|uniref:DUF4167 domain-containing protein n=1 Tax=Hyphococcus sp. TaxID=2038636 RepID=UPI003D1200BA